MISRLVATSFPSASFTATQAPVIAVMGDGTFGFHPAEIDTAVRYRLPFVAIVGNDARWNAEYQIQLRDYGRERLVGCELAPTRYDQVARAFGGYGEHVDSPDEVLPAVRRAIASGLPAVVDVKIEGAAWTGIRRSGSISMDMAWLASGRYDAIWEAGLAPWDVAPGLLMVKEAGGFVSDFAVSPGSVWRRGSSASSICSLVRPVISAASSRTGRRSLNERLAISAALS